MKLSKALIERYWKDAQHGREGRIIKEMKWTKEDWMKEKGYETEGPDEVE